MDYKHKKPPSTQRSLNFPLLFFLIWSNPSQSSYSLEFRCCQKDSTQPIPAFWVCFLQSSDGIFPHQSRWNYAGVPLPDKSNMGMSNMESIIHAGGVILIQCISFWMGRTVQSWGPYLLVYGPLSWFLWKLTSQCWKKRFPPCSGRAVSRCSSLGTLFQPPSSLGLPQPCF